MNVSYSREQRREALRVYRRTGSVSKTILLLRVELSQVLFRLSRWENLDYA